DTKLTLPDKYKDIPVVSVAWSAFSKNDKLEEVTVPGTVRVLGVSAFAECTSLKKVTLSDSVTKIDINCFTGCTSLTDLNLTKSVTDIGISAFSKCTSLSAITCAKENGSFVSDDGVIYSKDRSKIILYPAGKQDEKYTVSENAVSVSDRAFEGNIYLQTIDLKNVTDIGSYAFKDCSNLLNVIHAKTMTAAGGAFENTFYEKTLGSSSEASQSAQ
ncbi:MAG: leucine-rich repeat domain-containing protein, partial [Clostridia bacterium]|nr:leucine-rich repeat domain-containing protein [Clostridia bacterium]